jgi:hypothetical protein
VGFASAADAGIAVTCETSGRRPVAIGILRRSESHRHGIHPGMSGGSASRTTRSRKRARRPSSEGHRILHSSSAEFITTIKPDPLLSPDNHVVLLIDHQYLRMLTVRSHETSDVINNVAALAQGAKIFKVPTLVTTAFSEKAVNATVITLDQAPQGYAEFDGGAARKFVIDPHGLLGTRA